MDNQPSFDRALIIPALIGVLSVMGIFSILLFNRYNTERAAVTGTPTETPFKYIYLGTEPGISTEALPEESATAPASDEPPPVTDDPSISITPNRPGTPANPNAGNTVVPTLIIIDNLTPSPTSASAPPLNSGTYDDIDFRLIYSGEWTNQNNVSGAHQGTLHVSNILTTPGNSVTFRFIGLEARLFFQTGASLGVVQITLDGKQSELDQSGTSNERLITADKTGTHTVTITHIRGGSVNLDFVIVPSLGTPTVTPTATPTSAP